MPRDLKRSKSAGTSVWRDEAQRERETTGVDLLFLLFFLKDFYVFFCFFSSLSLSLLLFLKNRFCFFRLWSFGVFFKAIKEAIRVSKHSSPFFSSMLFIVWIHDILLFLSSLGSLLFSPFNCFAVLFRCFAALWQHRSYQRNKQSSVHLTSH